jgi:dihydroneopterin aldolase
MSDVIEIRKLRVPTHIGVPEEERATVQEVLVTILMTPLTSFETMNDDISLTVDYHAVSLEIADLAAEKPRRLIETLAVDIAAHLLNHHALSRVEVLVEKFILPLTECVSVRVVRERMG